MKKIFKEFVESASGGGIILFICVVLSLCLANSPLGAAFERFLHFSVDLENASVHLKYPVALWINDGLRAISFLLDGSEINREVLNGGLSTPRKAALPILCSIGRPLA